MIGATFLAPLMNTKRRLQSDLKDALRARDERRKSVIRMALAALGHAEVEQRDNLDDAAAATVLRKQVRQRRDTIDELREVNRPELLANEEAELAILEEYLPRLLSRSEITEEARQVVEEVGAMGAKQMGPVMRQLMSKLKGRAGGVL